VVEETIRNALFLEIHKSVDRVSADVMEALGSKEPVYPPNVSLLPVERQALANLHLPSEAKSGLRKLIASACVTPVFDLFCLLDGVADPVIGDCDPWLGLTLTTKRDEDENEPMLHDELYESYWLYKAHGDAHS
jgi:hypothetical protein